MLAYAQSLALILNESALSIDGADRLCVEKVTTLEVIDAAGRRRCSAKMPAARTPMLLETRMMARRGLMI